MPILWGDQHTTERRARLRRLQAPDRWEPIRALLCLAWGFAAVAGLIMWLLWESAHPLIER